MYLDNNKNYISFSEMNRLEILSSNKQELKEFTEIVNKKIENMFNDYKELR